MKIQHKSTHTKVRIPNRKNHKPTLALAVLAAFPLQVNADDSTAESADTSVFDKIWGNSILYKDEHNPTLQEFKLRGRYHGQYWDVDDANGSQSDWEDRRARFGFDAKLFEKKLELRADFQSNNGFNDIYDGLVDAYIRWKPTSGLSVTAGKTKPLIGQYDWLESTNSQPTFERSQIFNQLGINRASGLTVEGTANSWYGRAGIYSNDTPNNTADPISKKSTGAFGDGEFGDLNGGVSFTLGGGYDFKQLLDLDKADFRLDWLHSDRKITEDLVLNKYDDILSASFVAQDGPAAVVLEGYYASGGETPDVFGFFIQPTYEIIPKKVQLVGRYSYTNSDGPLGVVGQSRYEKNVAANSNRGDAYHSLYAGAQYFIHGDQLKLLAGVEWARLENDLGNSYDGFTILSGFRFSF